MHTTRSLFVTFAIGLLLLGGCKWGDNPSATSHPPTADAQPSLKPDGAAVPEAADLRCLPQLKAMIAWYGASQSAKDTSHQFQFVQRTGGDGSKKRVVINLNEVERYINFLRHSGFFSENYLKAQRQIFNGLQQSFARGEQSKETIEIFQRDWLFGVSNSQELISYQKWNFKAGEQNEMLYPAEKYNTINFDAGENTLVVTLDANCRIENWEHRSNEVSTVVASETADLRCLPQLKAMIAWYGASQAAEDMVHHFRFVRGVRPDGGGYFVVDFSEANRYLGFLRQSGFFSEKYLAAERQAFQDSQETFGHLKQTDGAPNGFALDRMFGVMVVQDMMHFTHAWKFKPGAGKNTIIFDTGESARAITFGADCKIEAMESVPNEPQNPDDFAN